MALRAGRKLRVNLEDRVPTSHLLRRIDVFVTQALAGIHREIAAFYSHTGRPSIDPELMMRMLIVGYCYGIRSERKLCEEVSLHLAYRWFCRLDLEDAVPDHSTFSKNRHGRFRDSDLLRLVFERVVGICLAAGLIKGEGFAVDASVIEADASRYHGREPETIDWDAVERPSRAVREYLEALDGAEELEAGRKAPKVISPSDPASAWTAKATKRVQFSYGLNALGATLNAQSRASIPSYSPMCQGMAGAAITMTLGWRITRQACEVPPLCCRRLIGKGREYQPEERSLEQHGRLSPTEP